MKIKTSALLVFLSTILSVQACNSTVKVETKVVGPGIKLVHITGGKFQMGSNEGEADEKPVHQIKVDDYWIGETEVTNQQYCDFLNSSHTSESESDKWINTCCYGRINPTEIWYTNGIYSPNKGFENYPVNSVTWLGAKAFCDYYKLRLPTEEEWEYAAGGPNHYDYPWGNAWVQWVACCNLVWDDVSAPCPIKEVKSYMANGYGLYDMAGNVWEWCSDWYDVYPGGIQNEYMGCKNKVMRGGSWHDSAFSLRCAFRGRCSPTRSYLDSGGYGFRVAADGTELR